MSQPSYYAVIPANVRYADIPANAKLLYGELTALTSKEGYCWASNSYLADLYRVSPGTISEWIRCLKEGGFIFYEIERMNQRKIYLSEKPEGGIGKIGRGVSEKPEHSITSSNTENIAVANAPARFEVVEIPDEQKEKKLSKAAYPNARQVFSWFPEYDDGWTINTTERKAAELLFKKGKEAAKKAIAYCVRHMDDEGFPIPRLTPYLLITNWKRIHDYSRRNG